MRCFYNLVKLPAFPEYDESKYSDMVIVRFQSGGAYGLIFASSRYWVIDIDGTGAIAVSPETEVLTFACTEKDFVWKKTDGGFTPSPDALWVYMNPSSSQYVWTYNDICQENSTDVVYYGSEPVPVYWGKSFQEGLAVGLSGNLLPAEQQKPVGWIYRGHLLPKIPEEVVYNGEVYAYRLIHRDPDRESTYEYSENYTLTCFKTRPTMAWQDLYRHLIYIKQLRGKAVQLRLNPERTGWGEIVPITANGTEVPLTYSVWANFSLYISFLEENVRIVAEEPVPMYEQGVRHG